MPHHHHLSGFWAAPALVVLVTYVVLAGRTTWSRWRTASFAGGCALVTVALTDPVASLAATDFRGHMLQHLLIGMLAPLALALGAPVTLLLRSLPVAHAGRLTRTLRGPAVHLLANPWTALALSAGGMAALYCTPLYGLVPAPPVHAHFLLAGYLFAWVVAGPDPAPRRPPVPVRLAVVGVAIAVHASLSRVMYAGWLALPAPSDQLRGAAEIMYYGGDAAELLLALALAASLRVRRTPEDADVELLDPGLTVRVPGEPEPVRRVRVPDRGPARARGPLTPAEYGDEDEPDPADL
ncbi:cytochrome c oxidase assembly protein [Nonomuraea sp. NPDC005692]|uniref:cytochrome c oxidase assembly protein n=1 Tax=Nonomuraea sp. NPDC005692 TaxID=3157168 RepID=UPI00340706FF